LLFAQNNWAPASLAALRKEDSGELENKSKNPKERIAKGDAWYTDDQLAIQLGQSGPRAVVEGRLRIFRTAISNWLLNSGKQREGLRFLDAGCGDGINLMGLSSIMAGMGIEPGRSLFGVDYNVARIFKARKMPGVAGVFSGSLLSLPFRDETWDVILCNQVLEHIYEDSSALLELNRVLRKDGLLIIGVPNEGCGLAQLRNNVLQPKISATTDHVNFYTIDSISFKIAAARLVIDRVERSGFFVPHTRILFLISSTSFGRSALEKLGRIIPSQAAGLIFICGKK